ncbi:MAG: CGNR zinc finger domain-containing protein [Hyphomicrobiaceae bacterium]
MSRETSRADFKFFGGRACLDFANSLNWRLTASPVELIPDYTAFLNWSEQRGTLPRRAIAALRKRASADAGMAQGAIKTVHSLRVQIIQAAEALWNRQAPDIGVINIALQDLPPQPQLAQNGDRLVFDLNGDDLRQPLWPILWSFTAVLASSDADRIGSCGAEGCGWFFVDESPNHTRLWCSDGCGNRERVRRSYAKRRSTP